MPLQSALYFSVSFTIILREAYKTIQFKLENNGKERLWIQVEYQLILSLLQRLYS